MPSCAIHLEPTIPRSPIATRQVHASLKGRPRRQHAVRLRLLACAVGLLCGTAQAQVPVIPSTPTNLASSVDRMISYRQQEHLWQTADGALHLLMNRGRLEPNNGLVLYSSYDGGTEWIAGPSWTDVGNKSTADGVLRGNTLQTAYSTRQGAIVQAELSYDSANRRWTVVRQATVMPAGTLTAENPSIGVDALGNLWSSFVTAHSVTGELVLRLYHRPSGGNAWQDTGLTFGPPGTGSVARSARLITMPGGMAVLYKVAETLSWAVRADGSPPTVPWVSTTVFVSPPPEPKDPYASHFSTVTDRQGNLHLVMADDGLPLYFRFNNRSGTWGTGRVLDETATVSYCQISLVDDRLVVTYSNGSDDSRVLVSDNRGLSFSELARLRPTPIEGAGYSFSRLETATISTNPLKVLRQFEHDRTDKLMLFTVPVP